MGKKALKISRARKIDVTHSATDKNNYIFIGECVILVSKIVFFLKRQYCLILKKKLKCYRVEEILNTYLSPTFYYGYILGVISNLIHGKIVFFLLFSCVTILESLNPVPELGKLWVNR